EDALGGQPAAAEGHIAVRQASLEGDLMRPPSPAVEAQVVLRVLPEKKTADRRSLLPGGQAHGLDSKVARGSTQRARSAQVDVPEVATVRGMDFQPRGPHRHRTVPTGVVPDPFR